MKINKPELKVVRFANDDVIATSLFYMNTEDFNAAMGTEYNVNETPYVYFNGEMRYVDGTSWRIDNAHAFDAVEDLGFIAGIPEIGFPGVTGYEAYVYENGFYTKGASYQELNQQ